MKDIQKIIDDIQKGQNIDLYVTVLMASVLAILNLFGLIPANGFKSFMMLAMAVLAYAILGHRHSLEQVYGEVANNKKIFDFLPEFPSTFQQKLKDSKEVMIIGTHVSSLLTSNYQIFVEKLKKGDSLKFLLMTPDGDASKMAIMRFPGVMDSNHENSRIKASINTLLELKKITPNNIEIKTLDFLFDYTAYLFDGNIIFIERHTFKISGGPNKPKACYEKGDGKWFEHLFSEANQLWASSSEDAVTSMYKTKNE